MALIHRFGKWLLGAIKVTRATITKNGLEVANVGLIPWREIINMRQKDGHGRASFRGHDDSCREVFVGSITKTELETAKKTWESALITEIKEKGFLEGRAVNCQRHPRRKAIISLVLAIAGCTVAGYFLIELHRRMQPLMPAFESWLFLAPLIAGGCIMGAILLTVSWCHWRNAQAVERWSHWRINNNGLSRRSPAGDWLVYSFAPGDRLSDKVIISGEEIPTGFITCGEIVWKLLIGLGKRRGVRVVRQRYFLNIALRCLFLWAPLISGGWLVWLTLSGRPLIEADWLVVCFPALFILVFGGAFLWFHIKSRKHFAEIEAGAEAVLDKLGW